MVDLLCVVYVFDAAFTAAAFPVVYSAAFVPPVVLRVVYESAEPAPHKECNGKPYSEDQ
jgi:hypothetical protein